MVLGGQHVDDLAAAPGAESHLALDQCKQRVVAATADPFTGMEVGAALPQDDLAGVDPLTAETLHAEPLGGGVRPLRVDDAPFLCAMVLLPQLSIAVTLTRV